jgi:tetratricopeptide (TPR) repeat protein
MKLTKRDGLTSRLVLTTLLSFVSTTTCLLAILAPLAQAADQSRKYKQPDLPKAELAELGPHVFGDTNVRAIDGLTVSQFAWLQPRPHVYVAPGTHLLHVQSVGVERGWSFQTDESTLLVDLKKGHRYVVVPWYFLNDRALPFDFGSPVEDARLQAARSFPQEHRVGFAWLQDVHFEIVDATGLPDIKPARLGTVDLSWITHDGWKYSYGPDIPGTINDLDKQIASHPEDRWAHRQRGLLEPWKSAPDYDKAVAETTKVIELDPRWARAYQERAWIWFLKGHADQAIDDLNKAIELDPGFTLAFLRRADVWSWKGDADRAIADYTRAIETDLSNLWSYHKRGNLWTQKKEYDKALADQGRAVQIAPNFAPAYAARGAIRLKKLEYDLAIVDYTRAIAIDPKYFSAYVGRAEAQVANKDYDKAIADYSWALKVDDRSSAGYAGRGRAHRLKGDNEQAIADYSKALELDPTLVYLYNERGVVWYVKGDLDRAASDFTEALQHTPENAQFCENLGTVYERKNNGAQAVDYYVKAAELRIAQNNLKNAIADWSAAITLDPRRAVAFQRRAEAYAQLGQLDLATADYTKALALAPGNGEWARRLRELKAAPTTPAPSQSSAAAPARAAAPAPAEPAQAEVIIEGTLLHYPDRSPVTGNYSVVLGVIHAGVVGLVNGAPTSRLDNQGHFRLKLDAASPWQEFVGEKIAPLVFENPIASGPSIHVMKLVKGRPMATAWEFPREPGTLSLDTDGGLFLDEKPKKR